MTSSGLQAGLQCVFQSGLEAGLQAALQAVLHGLAAADGDSPDHSRGRDVSSVPTTGRRLQILQIVPELLVDILEDSPLSPLRSHLGRRPHCSWAWP